MDHNNMNAFEHEHQWTETDRGTSEDGVMIQKKCDDCGMRMAIGPGHIESEEEAFRRRVIETVVSDIRANGKIRMALLGL